MNNIPPTISSSTDKKISFEKEWKEIRTPLQALAWRLTRNREDAQDLVQTAFINIWNNFEKFDGRTNFKNWALRITCNLYINDYRSLKRRQRPIGIDDAIDLPASSIGNPEEFIKISDQRILDSLHKIPKDFRTAVILSDLEGMTYSEIAEATQVPIGTVRSRLFRGRQLMRKYLTEADFDHTLYGRSKTKQIIPTP